MEWLQNVEDLLNDLVLVVQYSKVFAVMVCVAFLIVFSGLVIVNANVNAVKRQNEYLLEVIESRTLKGGKRDGEYS